MTFVVKFLVLVVGLSVGVSLMKYSFQLTQLFGHNSLAERYLGDGGTYSMWKILGVIVVIGSVIFVFS